MLSEVFSIQLLEEGSTTMRSLQRLLQTVPTIGGSSSYVRFR
jgi:hypothetical protein